MSNSQLLVTILLLALSVWITRFLPFLIFRDTGKLPELIEYLGRVLPAALMGLLVVYCFKDYDFGNPGLSLPALLSVGILCAVHLWKRNTILSISVGTAAYMLLLRLFSTL